MMIKTSSMGLYNYLNHIAIHRDPVELYSHKSKSFSRNRRAQIKAARVKRLRKRNRNSIIQNRSY